jgi:hypothetical protein
MKLLKIHSLLLFSILLLFGCKDNDPALPSASPVEGIWEGKYGNGSKTPDWYMGFQIDADGVIHELNEGGTKIGKGVWTITGDQFVSTYHNALPYDANYSLRATLTESGSILKGTWGFKNNDSDGGTFELTRKKKESKR